MDVPVLARKLEAAPVANLFKALGDETRVRLIALLCHGELCVCHLITALDLPQSTVSRQLGILRNAGIVATRREGTWIYYRLSKLDNSLCQAQIRTLSRSFGQSVDLKADVERLLRSRGPTACD